MTPTQIARTCIANHRPCTNSIKSARAAGQPFGLYFSPHHLRLPRVGSFAKSQLRGKFKVTGYTWAKIPVMKARGGKYVVGGNDPDGILAEDNSLQAV